MANKRLAQYKGEKIHKYAFISKEYEFGTDYRGLLTQVRNRRQKAFRTPTALKRFLKKRLLCILETGGEYRPPSSVLHARTPVNKLNQISAELAADVRALLEKDNVEKALGRFNKDSRYIFGCTLSYEVLRFQDEC